MSEDIEIENYLPWLLAITLLGGVMRVLLLGTKLMWLDETFSVWLASFSLPEMLQWLVKIDQHPPLYYALLHAWISNGDTSAYHVRFLSVLFGTATIPLVFLIGKRISGAMVGLAAALLLAVSPFHIYYSQETRMYALLAFNAAVAIYALVCLLTDPRAGRPIGSQLRDFWRAWRTPETFEPDGEGRFGYKIEAGDLTWWGRALARHHWLPLKAISTDLAWVAYILFTVLTLMTHNTAIFFLAAANIFVLGLMLVQRNKPPVDPAALRAPSLVNWVLAQAAILILWLPWLHSFIKQASGVHQRFWIPTPTWDMIVQALKAFINASGPMTANVTTAVWIVAGVMLALGVVHFRKTLPRFWLLLALFAVPFLGELAVSWLWKPIFWDRTLIWATVPLFVAVGAGVAQLRFRPLIILALGVIGFVNLFSASDYLRFYQKEDWNTPAREVAGFSKKGDLVLFNSNFIEIPFNYYFQPYEEYYMLEVEKRGLPLDLFSSGVLEPEMTAQDIPALEALLKTHDRVWLVYSHNSYTDPLGLIPKTFAAHKKIIREERFNVGVVRLYANP